MNAKHPYVAPVTFSRQIALAHGHPSGFDYIRLFLATEVLAWHTVLMSYGHDVQNQILNTSLFRAIPSLILPMFFALSGFLVAGSLDRTKNIFDFLCLRMLRVFPALCLVVLLSALMLGPLVTHYSLNTYFSDKLFASYFLTLLGDMQNQLPGVFDNNPFVAMVNGQLWTIPLEMMCYGLLGISALIGIYHRPKIFLSFVLIGQFIFGIRAIFGGPIIWGSVPTRVLFLCFLAGSALNVYREKIPFRRDLACLCGFLGFCLIYLPGGCYFIAAPIAYITIYLGLLNPRKIILVSSGDYSYGIYLFAFPIQQLAASIGAWTHHWYVNLLLSLPLTFIMAFLSWHLLEKRALALRQKIPQFHNWAQQFFVKLRTKATPPDAPTDQY